MTSNPKAAGSNPARGFSAQYLGGLLVINFIDMKIKYNISPKASQALHHMVTRFCVFAQIILRASHVTGWVYKTRKCVAVFLGGWKYEIWMRRCCLETRYLVGFQQ